MRPYVELDEKGWHKAGFDYVLETADDGALLQKLKRSTIQRQTLQGRIECKEISPEGMMVRLQSFQGEEPGRSDALVAFADQDGNFTAECLPGATLLPHRFGCRVGESFDRSDSVRSGYAVLTQSHPGSLPQANR